VIRLAWLAALLVLAAPAVSGATLTPAEYARALSRTAARLERAKTSPEAEQALAGLPAQVVVQASAKSTRLTVDNRELLSALRRQAAAGPQGIRTAAALVRSLESAVTTAAPPPPANAQEVLRRVLKRDEFRPPWWEKHAERFFRLLARVFEWLAGHVHLPRLNVHLPPRLWKALGLGALALVAATIVFLLARMLSQFAGPARPAPVGPAARPAVILPCSSWLSEAEVRGRDGDYRAAVRALHMAALMRLDEAGHVRYDSSHTDGRFVRALQARGQQDLAGVLAQLNGLFAVVWYGRLSAGPTEYAVARTLWTELEAAATP